MLKVLVITVSCENGIEFSEVEHNKRKSEREANHVKEVKHI